MSATFGDDNDDEGTPYADMSDEEFLAELRSHLSGESWTLGHWLELERRGLDILDADAELGDAVRAQWERTSSALQEALAPVREQLAEQFKALVPKLADLMPSIDYSQFMPKFELDLPKLDLPEFDLYEYVAPELANLGTGSVLDHQETIAALAEVQQDIWERENEVRQAHLDTAAGVARQVEMLGEIERRNEERHRQLVAGYGQVAMEVRKGHEPRWTLWATLFLTSVAAVASVIAVLMSLG